MAAPATADEPNGSKSAQSPDVSKCRDNDQKHNYEGCNKYLQRQHIFHLPLSSYDCIVLRFLSNRQVLIQFPIMSNSANFQWARDSVTDRLR